MGQGRWPPSPQSRNRRSIRLRSYDYTWPGAYFFTICTQGQEGFLDETLVRDMIESVWHDLPNRFSDVRLDAFVVMPDHVHGIIIIEDPRKGETQDSRRGEPCVRPEGRAGGAPGEDERPFPSGNLAPDDAGRADTRSAPTTKSIIIEDPRKGETQESRRGEPCVRPEGRAGGAPGEDERRAPRTPAPATL